MTFRYDPRPRCIIDESGTTVAALAYAVTEADPTLGHTFAAAHAMRDALEAIMEGCHYGILGGDPQPRWHSIRMPSSETMDKVRAALAAARGETK